MSDDLSNRCPVAALAQELRAVWAAYKSADERLIGLKDGPERIRLDAEYLHLEDRITTLEEAISQRRATSPEGLLVQLALAAEDVDSLASYGVDAHPTRVKPLQRQARRLLHSAASAMERLHGLRREDLVADDYLSRAFDPLAALDRLSEEARA